MRTPRGFSFALPSGLVLLAVLASAQTPSVKALPAIRQGFEPNRGQAEHTFDFTSHGPGYTLLLRAGSAELELIRPAAAERRALSLQLAGADDRARGEGLQRQAARSNYFYGNDPKRWLTDIPQFGRVTYHAVYPGIDVAYYGDNDQLEYDFILSPYADPGNIRIAVKGADRVRIDPLGDLVLSVGSAEIRERKPRIYQETSSGTSIVAGRYVALGGNQVGFALGPYDRTAPLVIDPVLVFSTFFGSTGADTGNAVATDSSGNVYMCGSAAAAGSFSGAVQIGSPASAGSAAFVAKISPAGALLSSTFIAGSGDQASAVAVAVDTHGNIYLTGNTSSSTFPTLNPVQASYSGGGDVFALELNSAGNALVYSTYIGGSSLDASFGIGVDGAGNTFVTGQTNSANFPVVNATQNRLNGTTNAFAVKIAAGGGPRLYSTYFGGAGADYGRGATVDNNGDLVFYGTTTSTNFPVLNAIVPTFCGWTQGQQVSAAHGWAAMLSPAGAPVFATYICGSVATDQVRGAAMDASGNVLLTGGTASTTFPLLNPVQAQYGGGGSDAFVMKLSPTGVLLYSTYLGGSGSDTGRGIATDIAGNTYVAGYTNSTNFSTINGLQRTLGGADDAFLTKLNAAGSAIIFSTYIGGTGEDYGYGLATDSLGNAYVTGLTLSSNFPKVSPLQATYGGGTSDAFLTAIATCSFVLSSSSTFGAAGGSGAASVTTTPECGWTASPNNPWITITSSPNGIGSGSVTYSVAANNGATRQGSLTIGGQTFTVNQNGGPALNVTESHAGNFTQGQAGATYTVTVSNGAGASSTSGAVTLTQTLPTDLSLVSITGSGWSCTGATCTRSDVLAAGSSYPVLTVTVNVAANAATPLAPQVSVSGGGAASPATATDITIVGAAPAPALTLSETHSGNFTQGQNGATYTVTVGNSASGIATSGVVTLTQILPAGLTLVSMAGAGWSCTGSSCTRSDVLAAGSSYPAVTVTVNVAANAGTPLAAQATVSGGGAPSAVTTTDNTTIVPTAVLTVSETHSGAFTQGQNGATYTVTVGNAPAGGPTAGVVTLVQTLPAGLTLVSMAGAGWSCAGATCTRGDVLAPGGSYPVVTVTVNVDPAAGSPLAAQVTASGGGAQASATATDSTTIGNAAAPALSVSETHAGNFMRGQTGATYTVSVANGATGAATTGVVTLTQTLPAGLTLVSMAGAGWSCTGASCTRADALAAGASYPPVTVTVNVAADAGSPLVPQVSVSGGGAASPATATDSTTITAAPSLTVSQSHTGNFTQGQSGAVYTATAGAAAGGGSTAGTVTMTETLPAGLTLVSMAGPGWSCTGASCTRSDALAAGSSYPAVTVTVNVAANAGTPLVPQVSVSGGGAASTATATDSTTITPLTTAVLSVTETHVGNFKQGQAGAVYTVTVANGSSAGPTSGTVTLTETVPTGLTLVSMAGTGWTCGGATCTRSDSLAGGSSYPSVTVTVNVAPDAPGTVNSQVNVSGGGSAAAVATDSTTIQPVVVLSLNNTGATNLNFQGLQVSGVSGTQTNTCGITIPVNTGCTIRLTLTGSANSIFVGPDWAQFSQFSNADQQVIQSPPDPRRLILIGDSLTLFWDSPSPYGQGSLSSVRPFINRGIAGQTTEQMLVRFREDVIKLHPAAVHIMGGTNDLGANTGPMTNDQILDGIVSMAEIAKANGIIVFIGNVTPVVDIAGNQWSIRRPASTIIALNQLIQTYCQQSGASYIDYYSVLADSNGVMNVNLTVDGLHPNTSGFAAMTQVAQRAFQQVLGY